MLIEKMLDTALQLIQPCKSLRMNDADKEFGNGRFAPKAEE